MMPRMDGTGPMGCGPRMGWGAGRCRNVGFAPRGYGLCRSMANMACPVQPSREALTEAKTILQKRLAEVDRQLDTL
ncbi:MAG: DUF5320 domain-containing protein [Clostridiales bacterium]|nr:DUF5320 domain-containing protein [Clostridiales bacterium]